MYVLTRTPRAAPGTAGGGSRYDVALAFACIARWPKQARRLAAEQAGDEGGQVWMDPRLSKLKRVGESHLKPQVLVRDFNAG